MGDLLPEVDLVIEARDARLPLTSINGAFDDLLATAWGPIWNGPDGGMVGGMGSLDGASGSQGPGTGMVDRKGKMREKVIAYTKRDLAETKYEEVSLEKPELFVADKDDGDMIISATLTPAIDQGV